jgi:protein phosphatase
MLVADGRTHRGKVRPVNEDGFLVDLDLGFVAVADGLGGHNAGEVASALALETIQKFLVRSADGEGFTWPYGINPTLSFQGNRLMTAVKLANRRVLKAGESREDYAGLGTTIVAMLFNDEQISFTGVGDSRIYVCKDGQVRQITEDDSWAAIAGRVSGDEKPNLPPTMKNVLTNVVGAREPLEMDVFERAVDPAETYLLCSDGLHNSMDPQTLSARLGSAEPAAPIADALVRLALERDGSDNITALVARWQGGA